ncbi:glycosyltransferase family 4 protein [uncultured Roseobacter sp.]|uniref:glycosyltransferase family 4 protein n=1 Tax=uncultured Roseobacter sp. TaxID=114847 RepID=UPI002615D874|nr:glycosyltransferase family 4 protein [uncultured Roseobacter sp.]
MKSIRIVHLIDDSTPGGIMRMLDHLLTLPELSAQVHQTVRTVRRGSWSADHIGADVIVSHLALSWRGLPALVTLRALNPLARIIHIEHSYTPASAALNVNRKKRFHTMLRVAYSLFDDVVAVSHTQAAWMRTRALVRNDALTVIHPQVDMSALTGIPAPRPGGRTIGAFGRLEPQKGFDTLIEAFRLCPDTRARLVIFGDGQEQDRLQMLAGADHRITFKGHTDDLTAAYAQVDIVAMPSRWEAFGLVAQEARASGRSVLVSAVDGLRDQITPGISAVSQRTPEAWARVLEKRLDEVGQTEIPASVRAGTSAEEYAAQWLALLSPRSGEKAVTPPGAVSAAA